MNEERIESAHGAEPATVQPSPLDAYPAIRNWSESNGYALMGFVVNLVGWTLVLFLLKMLFDFVLGPGPVANAIASLIGTYLQAAVLIVYATIFYPSYFTAKPILTSSSDISFANFLAGSLIFGWLWTRNLHNSYLTKRPDKGVSYIVAIVLAGAGALMATGSLLMSLLVVTL